jgi:hypothetical protein
MKRTSLAFTFLSLVALATTGWSAPTNLSLGGTATGSSEGFGTVFADAIDGNRDGAYGNGSVWHANGHPEINPPTFYEVDLGSDVYLDRLQIYPRTDAIQNSVRNFRLTVRDSNDVQVFSQDFFTGAGQATNDVRWGTNAIRNVVGQKVRIERLSQDPVPLGFMTFSEFEVYGQATPIQPNLALGGTITANTGGGFNTTLQDAIDGNIDGHYSHTEGGSHPIFHADSNRGDEYWQLDLGASYDLDYLNIFSRTDFGGNTVNVRLDVLAADGATVVHTQNLQMQGTDLGGPRYNQTIDLTAIDGRYIKLTALEGGGDRYLTFAEVEAFAVPIPEPSTLVLAVTAAFVAGISVVRRRAAK